MLRTTFRNCTGRRIKSTQCRRIPPDGKFRGVVHQNDAARPGPGPAAGAPVKSRSCLRSPYRRCRRAPAPPRSRLAREKHSRTSRYLIQDAKLLNPAPQPLGGLRAIFAYGNSHRLFLRPFPPRFGSNVSYQTPKSPCNETDLNTSYLGQTTVPPLRFPPGPRNKKRAAEPQRFRGTFCVPNICALFIWSRRRPCAS